MLLDLLCGVEHRIRISSPFFARAPLQSSVHSCLQCLLNRHVRRTVDGPMSEHPEYRIAITQNGGLT
jgi:hypothetical protein